jgi:hypothetical protein
MLFFYTGSIGAEFTRKVLPHETHTNGRRTSREEAERKA